MHFHKDLEFMVKHIVGVPTQVTFAFRCDLCRLAVCPLVLSVNYVIFADGRFRERQGSHKDEHLTIV